MKIIFLGTGASQGIPVIGSNHSVCLSKDKKDKRLRSSVLIEKNKKSFLIDCSPDFRYQMLKNNLSKLDAILITHEHYDHIGGLEDIRPLNIFKKNIPIYGLSRVLENLKKRFFYIFLEKKKYLNTFKISLNKINETCESFLIDSFKIDPLFIWHGDLSILGFRMDKFAYITDASKIPENTIKKLKGLDILVLNILRKKYEKYLDSLLETINFIKKICPQQTFLTHISYMLGFHEKIQKILPNNVCLAYDGLII